ncbi:MAG: alkaline shock response membrane anchor protein AmaP [Actinomycetota bacterium]|nr:alkaline shock response membrane anchor protein AmaP [Actinomycetota bacterium]
MNNRNLSTVALVAGALALVGGIWGLVDHSNSGDSEGALEETVMWIAIVLILLSISAIASALASRSHSHGGLVDDQPRPPAP